ncbi:MAG: hypothetical protein F6K41_38960 [Symploca sp. SIO3E6]|nr:hypothetical protein [Caldora sp. SIO3E6]
MPPQQLSAKGLLLCVVQKKSDTDETNFNSGSDRILGLRSFTYKISSTSSWADYRSSLPRERIT